MNMNAFYFKLDVCNSAWALKIKISLSISIIGPFFVSVAPEKFFAFTQCNVALKD